MAGPECTYLERFQAGFNKTSCQPETDQSRPLGVMGRTGQLLAQIAPFPEVRAAEPSKPREQPHAEVVTAQSVQLTKLPIPRDAWQSKTFVGDIVLSQENSALGALAKASAGRSLSEVFFTNGRDQLVGEALSSYLMNAHSPDHAYKIAYRALELALTEMQGNALIGKSVDLTDPRQFKAMLIGAAQAARQELSNNA